VDKSERKLGTISRILFYGDLSTFFAGEMKKATSFTVKIELWSAQSAL
jgi:hypothetical protein